MCTTIKPFIAHCTLSSIQIHFTQNIYILHKNINCRSSSLCNSIKNGFGSKFSIQYKKKLFECVCSLHALSSWWWTTSTSSHPLTWRSAGITWQRPGWPGTWRTSHWSARICSSQRHILLNMYPFPSGCSTWFARHLWWLAEQVSFFLCNKNGRFITATGTLLWRKTRTHSSLKISRVWRCLLQCHSKRNESWLVERVV